MRSLILGLSAPLLLALAVSGCTGAVDREACDCDRIDRSKLAPADQGDKQAEDETRRTDEPSASPPATRNSDPAPTEGPRLRVLGLAQDGGLPHAACDCERCDAARRDPDRASPVASVAVIKPSQTGVWVIDATPDLPAQIDMLADARELDPGQVDRAPLSGVLLTHAHMGHYLGLAHLGFEAASTEGIPVWASPRMVEFLSANAPWDQLVRLHNIEPRALEPGAKIQLAPGLHAEALLVPHRGEYTDTYGYYVEGERRRVLYIPDTDPWSKWSRELDEILVGVELLLVDGTFYSGDELPGRDVSEIGHPLMRDTSAWARIRAGGRKIEAAVRASTNAIRE